MTAPSAVDRHIIDIGPPQWCWSHLNGAAEGLLSYRTGRSAIALAVPYTITEKHVTIPVAPFNDAAWLAASGEATLEVTGLHGDGLRWVVRSWASETDRRVEPDKPRVGASGPSCEPARREHRVVVGRSGAAAGAHPRFCETSLEPSADSTRQS